MSNYSLKDIIFLITLYRDNTQCDKDVCVEIFRKKKNPGLNKQGKPLIKSLQSNHLKGQDIAKEKCDILRPLRACTTKRCQILPTRLEQKPKKDCTEARSSQQRRCGTERLACFAGKKKLAGATVPSAL